VSVGQRHSDSPDPGVMVGARHLMDFEDSEGIVEKNECKWIPLQIQAPLFQAPEKKSLCLFFRFELEVDLGVESIHEKEGRQGDQVI
jgi:hypothetical protein